MGRGRRRERDPPAGPLAAAGARRGPPDGSRPRQVTDSLTGRARGRPGPGQVAGRRAGRSITARDGLPRRGHAVAPVRRDRQARRTTRARRSSTRTAARPRRRTVRFQPFKLLLPARASPSSTSTSAARPATAVRSGTPTTTSGATRTSTTSSTPRAGPRPSPGRTAGSRSSVARTAATWSCAPCVEEPAMWTAGVDLYGDSEIAESYPPRRPDRPARPPADDGLAPTTRSATSPSGAGRRSTGRSGSRRRCSSSTGARTSASCRS